MTLQQLKYVIAIAECGSITSAAKKLLVAQPSLSKSVSELEKEMGITIFFRNNRGIYLSDEGITSDEQTGLPDFKAIQEYCHKLLKEIKAERNINQDIYEF